jgi:hypothetical protein
MFFKARRFFFQMYGLYKLIIYLLKIENSHRLIVRLPSTSRSSAPKAKGLKKTRTRALSRAHKNIGNLKNEIETLRKRHKTKDKKIERLTKKMVMHMFFKARRFFFQMYGLYKLIIYLLKMKSSLSSIVWIDVLFVLWHLNQLFRLIFGTNLGKYKSLIKYVFWINVFSVFDIQQILRILKRL